MQVLSGDDVHLKDALDSEELPGRLLGDSKDLTSHSHAYEVEQVKVNWLCRLLEGF